MPKVVVMFLSIALNVYAQHIDLPTPPPKDGNPKLESALWEAASAAKGLRKPIALPGGLQATKDGKLIVFLVPEIGEETSSIDTQAVLNLHGDTLAVSRHFVRAAIPLERLDDAASIQGVRFIQRPIRAQTQQTVTEGASEIKALANQAREVKGQGVKIAVIDPGFAGADVLPGDMPFNFWIKNYTAPNDSIFTGNNPHGSACAEVIYDIVPEATLYLLKIGDFVDFENAKDFCVQEKVDIYAGGSTQRRKSPSR